MTSPSSSSSRRLRSDAYDAHDAGEASGMDVDDAPPSLRWSASPSDNALSDLPDDEDQAESTDDHLVNVASGEELQRLRRDHLVRLYISAGLSGEADTLTKTEIIDSIVAAREDVADLPPSSPRGASSDEHEYDAAALRRRVTVTEIDPTHAHPSKDRSFSNEDGDVTDEEGVDDDSSRPLNVTDALGYLDAIKSQYADQPEVYTRFLDIMKDFRSQIIDTPAVIQRVLRLFHGNRVLIQGFNTFLPVGYRIYVSENPADPNTITVTTPMGTTTHNNDGLSTTFAHQPHPIDPELDSAIQYLNKIKVRYADYPNTYKQFLETLQAYQEGQKLFPDVYVRLQHLFKDAPDLWEEFKMFLPELLPKLLPELYSDAVVLDGEVAGGQLNGEKPQDSVILTLRDINEQFITISLPVQDCRSWQTFREQLTRQKVQALSYIKANQFVVRLEDDSKELLFEEKWEQWILPFLNNAKLQPRVALCIIRNSCCKKPTENENGFCRECGMQFLQEEPSYLDPLQLLASADTSTTPTSMLENPDDPTRSSTTPPAEVPIEAVSTSVVPAVILSAQNSVVRRRRLPLGEERDPPSPIRVSSPEPDIDDETPKKMAPAPRRPIADIARQFARSVGYYSIIAHMYITAPPFIDDKSAIWDHKRLEARLNAFQNWVLTVNGVLFAAPAAILALSSIASSPVPQSFVILSGIFALFGLVYTLSLAFYTGDCKEFSDWFLRQQDHPNIVHRSPLFWNSSTMMCLPLTWMAWAVLSLLLSLVSLAVQIFVFDLQSISSDPFPNPAAGTPKAMPIRLNIFQLAVFTLAVGWSLVYVFMIYFEIRKCRARGNPLRQDTRQLEMGILRER